MSTFIGQLIGFAVIVYLVVRYVAPPIRQMMKNQQETVRTQLDDSAQAKKRLDDATKAHEKAVAKAKEEAERITAEARNDSERIVEQIRAQADAEVERIKVQGAQQVQLQRAQLIRQLRQDLGRESIERASGLVRDFVARPEERAATVDRFLDELDAMAPSEVQVGEKSSTKLRSASRESLAAVVKSFDGVSAKLDPAELSTLADELASIVTLLTREPILARHFADPSADPAAKDALVDRLLGDKVGGPTLELLKAAVSTRWSTDANLIDALEYAARLALLVRAEKDNVAEDVEDQLFRVSRVLDAAPRLSSLLSDYNSPADGRIKLLKGVIGRGGNSITVALLSQTVGLLRRERADEAVLDLAELAVARRGEVVAHVNAAADLTDAQRTRLTEVLTRIYGHQVSVQLHTNPELLGGLSITVGDEVIDGTLSSKLAAAVTQLPD